MGNPYLDIQRLLAIAQKHKADAIHPGYGYLSENANFAKAVSEADLIWIGPGAEAISVLGDKAACKQFLRERTREVPLIPGLASRSQDPTFLSQQADKIGYPVLLKASAGGGGKGMRVVENHDDFLSNLKLAKSEAIRSFGSDDMLLEKYISHGKHVEVQVFGDNHGNCLILGDRECSVQRRHQKVVEEAPAMVSDNLKKTMEKAARAIVLATGYSGAGTVEFIVDVIEQQAYFLEVNTRIQVEHPITEEIFGIDIVSLQIFVALDGKLSDLPAPSSRGHAIELRLCAEDPYAGFIPQTGYVTLFQESKIPARYESSIKTGDEVSIFFDPMIAKVIVYDVDRPSAIAKAERVMASSVCLGLQTNQEFLINCLKSSSFHDSSYTTSFIEDNIEQLTKRSYDMKTGAVIASAIVRALRPDTATGSSNFRSQSIEVVSAPTKLEYCLRRLQGGRSPSSGYEMEIWPLKDAEDQSTSKALNKEGAQLISQYYNSLAETKREVLAITVVEFRRTRTNDHQTILARIAINEMHINILATVHQSADGVHTLHLDKYGTFVRRSSLVGFGRLDTRQALGASDATIDYKAPMPGRVLRIEAKSGSTVSEGQSLLVVESMKTEVRVLARTAGKAEILVKEGQVVSEGTLLAHVNVLKDVE